MRFLSRSSSSRAGVLARAGLLVLAALHLTCNQAILTAPLMSTITLVANPQFIPANGGVSVISAIVIEPNTGTPVADGTVVQFFTNLGRIQEQAKTNDGVARVNLIADSRSGEATVTAFSGAATATLSPTVNIGGGIPPSKIVLTANPQRLIGQRASSITATVVDQFGNPVPNVALIFTVDAVKFTIPPPTPPPSPSPAPTPIPSPIINEFMESRGSPVFTDNNGRAIDVMRTNRDFGAPEYTVTIGVQLLAGSISKQSIDVFIN